MLNSILERAADGYRAERELTEIARHTPYRGLPVSGLMGLLRWEAEAPSATPTVNEFCRRFYHGENCSYVVRGLVGRGLIEADKDKFDRRVVRLRITARGFTVCAALREMAEPRMAVAA